MSYREVSAIRHTDRVRPQGGTGPLRSGRKKSIPYYLNIRGKKLRAHADQQVEQKAGDHDVN